MSSVDPGSEADSSNKVRIKLPESHVCAGGKEGDRGGERVLIVGRFDCGAQERGAGVKNATCWCSRSSICGGVSACHSPRAVCTSYALTIIISSTHMYVRQKRARSLSVEPTQERNTVKIRLSEAGVSKKSEVRKFFEDFVVALHCGGHYGSSFIGSGCDDV